MIIIGMKLRANLSKINKYILSVIAFSLCCCRTFTKNEDSTIFDEISQTYVYTYVEIMPQYKGGDSKFLSDFAMNFNYNYSGNDDMRGKICLQFVIDDKNTLIGARICNKTNITKYEEECLNTLRKMQNWESGVHNGKRVKVLVKKMINIDLQRK